MSEGLAVDVEKGIPEATAQNNNDQGGDWLGVDGDNLDGPLTSLKVKERREMFGMNALASEKKNPWYMFLLQSLFHPFNILLVTIAAFSALADEYSTSIIISVMVLISTTLRFYQEWKSESAVHGLLKLITKSVSVIRYDSVEPMAREMTVPSEELVPGDWVVLRPGELVPADAVILTSKVFFVSQAALTGEALPVEKYRLEENPQETTEEREERMRKEAVRARRVSLHRPMSKCKRFFRVIFGLKISAEAQLDQNGYELREDLSCKDHIFMGSQVITGMATVRIIRTGYGTLFGRMAEALSKAQPINPFQQGVKRISWSFFVTMALMIPPVVLSRGLYPDPNEKPEDSWRNAWIFALAVAVGLTPEMLPMIVNANLAKGSMDLARKSSIIKKLDAIINLGAVDTLCTDKTGTLTRSVVQLSLHMNPYGITCFIPLQIAYLNSYFQSVLQNPLDTAITAFYDKLAQKPSKDNVESGGEASPKESNNSVLMNSDTFVHRFSRLDEVPFDFVRRRLSVILKESGGGRKDRVYLVCKGAVEELLSVCTNTLKDRARSHSSSEVFPTDSEVHALTPDLISFFLEEYADFTKRGSRVLAVAYKAMPTITTSASAEDEANLTFVGFLSFTDPPKESAKAAIVDLRRHNIEIKVLTGDAANICTAVCNEINLPVNRVITGEDLMTAEREGTVEEVVRNGTIFAKLTPLQKLLVVQTLKSTGHVVAFMGDGINDAPALKEADVGISVDNGVDICREAADVILLDKDLKVVVEGIRIGRQTYGNTIKYIAMAVSSNFGNVFSVLVAVFWLPYEPMGTLHILTQNLLYDFSQIAIPWDTMDEDFLMVPHKWKIRSILRFMVWMGPWSSVFDISTFAFMYFYYDIKTSDDPEKVKMFQTAWFTVGLLTQTLIVHMIRTAKIPLLQSRASCLLISFTVVVMGIGLALPYVPWVNDRLEFYKHLPIHFYYFLGTVLLAYCVAANVAKCMYVRIFQEWF